MNKSFQEQGDDNLKNQKNQVGTHLRSLMIKNYNFEHDFLLHALIWEQVGDFKVAIWGTGV